MTEPQRSMVRFVLPGLPPSLNHSHMSGRGRRFMTPQAKAWVESVEILMMSQRGRIRLAPDAELAFAVRLYGKWGTTGKKAKSAWRRLDLSNRLKLLEDCAARVMAFDDSQVTQLRAEKIEAATEQTQIDIWDRGEMP